jgi:chaperonin GroEL (HSP60 family)
MVFLAEPSACRIMNDLRMFKQGADEEKAEVARLSSSDLVKLTLGPNGMYKILWNMSSAGGSVEVNNDGASF